MPEKIKKPAKKAAKKSAAKAKAVAVKKTKAKIAKSKSAVKTKAKSKPVKATKTRTKVAVKKSAKKAPVVKAKSPTKKKAKVAVKKPVAPTVINHGPDQHFIPTHDKNAPVIAPDGKIAEKQFHHNEEVALHQENLKVKSNMASRMGRKRIFRILGR